MEERIIELLENGNRREALRLLEEWGQGEAYNETLFLLWGEVLYAEGRMPDALNKFNAILRQNPEHTKARNYVIMINNILGYYCKDMFNP